MLFNRLSRDFNVDIHSDVFESIWFKLCVLIDSVELFIIDLDLHFKDSHWSARKQKLLRQFSLKVFSRFARNLVCCWDVLVWWTSYSCYLVHSALKGHNPIYVISSKTKQNNNKTKSTTFNVCLYSDIYRPISFKLGMMIETTSLLHFCVSLEDLNLHWRWQLCDKSKWSLPIFKKIWQSICHSLLSCWSCISFAQVICKWGNSADVISKNIQRPVSGQLWTVLFQTWSDAEHGWALQFDSSLNDLDVHSRSQGYGKARAYVVILL